VYLNHSYILVMANGRIYEFISRSFFIIPQAS
jgi:hypothetical protein